jgi:hypothetical protein
MSALMEQLNKTFGGAAKNNIPTYAGQLAILKISAGKALENIGKGLISFLKGFTKTNSITDLGLAIEDLGTKIGDIFRGLPIYIKTFFASTDKAFQESWFGRNVLLPLITALGKGLTDAADAAAAAGKRIRALETAGGWGRLFDTTVIKKFKKAAANAKLQGMFDIDAIQIEAALKGKISELDRARLLSMKALKTEDQSDDIKALERLEQAKIAADAADRARKIKALQDTISFNKAALDDWEANFAKMIKAIPPSLGNVGGVIPASPNQPSGVSPNYKPPMGVPTAPPTNTGTFTPSGDPFAAARAALPGVNFNPSAVAVTVNANTIADPDQLTRLIQAGIQAVARNGWSSSGSASGF